MIARAGRLATVALAAGVALAASLGTAEAHRLKLFATVEAGEVVGHAFFVGGGRPAGVDLVARDGRGVEVHRAKTDAEGGFHWRPATASDLVLTVDAGDGHYAEAHLTADRFAAVAESALPVTTAAPSAAPTATPAPAVCPPGLDAATIDAAVDRAVSRRLRPLLEAYDAAEGRLRFNDVMGGVGMIVGLAGTALWASARRRARRDGEGGGPA